MSTPNLTMHALLDHENSPLVLKAALAFMTLLVYSAAVTIADIECTTRGYELDCFRDLLGNLLVAGTEDAA